MLRTLSEDDLLRPLHLHVLILILYITESVCLPVYFFLMHGHSFERIWTKFGMWHPYTPRMVMDRLASAARARRLALHV